MFLTTALFTIFLVSFRWNWKLLTQKQSPSETFFFLDTKIYFNTAKKVSLNNRSRAFFTVFDPKLLFKMTILRRNLKIIFLMWKIYTFWWNFTKKLKLYDFYEIFVRFKIFGELWKNYHVYVFFWVLRNFEVKERF